MPDTQPSAGKARTADELADEDHLHGAVAPEVVEPPILSPEPSSVEDDVPVHTEAHRGPDDQAAQAPSDDTPEPESLPEFDPRYTEEFEGLLYLGYLTRDFVWAGHKFSIRTLTTDEVLEVALLVKPYQGTLADAKAYQAAMCAACVVKVDERPLPAPITMDPSDTPLSNRFEFVRRSWYPLTLDAVYEEFLRLEQTVTEVIAAMGRAVPLAA